MNARWLVSVVLFVLVILLTKVGAGQVSGEEVVSGVPTDGSIIIDETIWLRLVGEPGALMSDAHSAYLKKDFPASAKAIRQAASFLFIAESNAFPRHKPVLVERAEELDHLATRVVAGKVASREELEAAFASAHLAMSKHHAAKAADMTADNRPLQAAGYMRSAARHLERSAFWAGKDLQTDTEQTIDKVRDSANELKAGTGKIVEETGKLLEALGDRIERFGKGLKPAAAKPDKSSGAR